MSHLIEQYIEGIYKTKALLIKKQPFTLQSGKKSHVYLNHRHFLCHQAYLKLIATIYNELAQEIKGNYILGAVDSIMSSVIVGAMSVMFQKDYLIVKKTPLKHGTQEYIFGEMSAPIVLIDDMTSTGDTLLDAAQKIRQSGGIVEYAIISAYRETMAIENLQAQGIQLLSMVSFEQIIMHLQPKLIQDELTILQQNPLIFG